MSTLSLDATDIAALTALATVLIPGTAEMPAVGNLKAFDRLLRSSVAACGYADEQLRAALDAVPACMNWETSKAFATAEPGHFQIVSVLASAAYYMAPEVLNQLKFPIDRQHPAADDEFAEEYLSGILDPVIARGKRYRDPA